MSTLRTFNLQNPDSGTVNIEMDQGGNTLMTGIATVRGAAHFTSTSGSDAVGIGTDVTAYKLDVRVTGAEAGLRVYNPDTSSNASGIIRLGNDDNQNSAFLRLNGSNNTSAVGGAANLVLGTGTAREVHLATSGTSRLHITSAGNVAIGHNSAPTKLGIRGTSASTDATVQIVGNGVSTLLLGQDAAGGVIRGQGGSNQLKFKVGGSGDDAAATGGVEALRIASNGNIGVGGVTGTDYSLLDGIVTNTANGSAGLLINSSSSSHNAYMSFGYGSGSGTSHADQFSAYIGRVGDDTLILGTNNNIRLRITSAGLVGVNCTPLSHFQVKGATDANVALTAMSGEAAVEAFNDAGSANVPLRVRGSTVKLYTNTTLKLDVQSAQSYLYGTSDGILNLDTTDGRGTFIRFKENGTTKAWVGCAEGMGGGTSSPDQDDLGLRSGTGNILFSSNGGERLRITENGRVLINRTTPTDQTLTNLNANVKLVVNGSTITKHGYKADVGTSYVSIPGANVGNETSVFLVTVQGNGGGNFHSSATYILCSGAYNKTFTQLGSAAGHFGNGVVQAQLSSYSGTSSSVQVRRSGSSGTCDVQVHMFKLL